MAGWRKEYKLGGDRSSFYFWFEDFIEVRTLVTGCSFSRIFQLLSLISDSGFLLLRPIRTVATLL